MLTKLALLLGGASALELTPANWDSATSGKQVFIKFLAPWCGHCKSMKPAWDKLMGEFANSPSALVADVDCTAAGQPLCNQNGVKGYPTIKYGTPGDLKDYKGGRDFDSLKGFADKNLGPVCNAENLKECDSETKKKYETYLAMPTADVEKHIKEMKAGMKQMEDEIAIVRGSARVLRKRDREAKEAEKKKAKEAEKAKKSEL